MNKNEKKPASKSVKINFGRTTPNPSNSLKPKVDTKPKDKK